MDASKAKKEASEIKRLSLVVVVHGVSPIEDFQAYRKRADDCQAIFKTYS